MLIVSDLDGTLLNSEKTVSERSYKIINEYIKNGGLFSVATARTAGTAVEMLKNINVNFPVILMNGTMIYDINKEKYIKYETIDKCDVEVIIDSVKNADAEGFLYVFNGEKIIAYYEEISTSIKEFYDLRKREEKYKVFKKTDDFLNHIDEECVYFALMGKYDALSNVYEKIKNMNLTLNMYEDIYEKGLYYLEISSADAKKGIAVRFLKDMCNDDKTIVFGDNLNDLDMMEYADLFVAPDNAHKSVKEKAHFICKSNNDDGVSLYIKENL